MTQQKVGELTSAPSATFTGGPHRHNSIPASINNHNSTSSSSIVMASTEKDIGPAVPPKTRNSIGHLHQVAPVLPFSFSLSRKSSKISKLQDTDPEVLRRTLLEEAKQRRIMEQAEADKAVILKAHTAGVFGPTSSLPPRTTSLRVNHTRYELPIHHAVNDDMTAVNSDYTTTVPTTTNGGESSIRYNSALGRHKAPHPDAIVLSSEKMSPAKNGSIARLESVKISEGHPRVPSFSGIIEQIADYEDDNQVQTPHRSPEESPLYDSTSSITTDTDGASSFVLVTHRPTETSNPDTTECAPRRHLNVPAPLVIRTRSASPSEEGSGSASQSSAYTDNHTPCITPGASLLSELVSSEVERQLVHVIEDIESQLHTTRYNFADAVGARWKKAQEALNDKCDGIHEKIDENYQDVTEKIDYLGRRVKRVEALTTGLAKGVNSLNAKYEKATTEGFASINESLASQEQKLDTVGKVLSSCEERLVTAKDGFNELNLKVDEVKDGYEILSVSNKSLLEKTDLLMEQKRTESEHTATLTADMKFVQTGFSNLQEDNKNIVTGMNNIVAAVNQLTTDNLKLRQENQTLAANNFQLNNSVAAMFGQFQAQASQINAIYNFLAALNQNTNGTAQPSGAMLFNQPTGSINSIVNTSNVQAIPNSPDSALHLSLQAPMAIPTIPTGPVVTPAAPTVAASAPVIAPAATTTFFSAPAWYSSLSTTSTTSAQA